MISPVASHLRSVSLLDSHKMQNIHKIYDKNLVPIDPSDVLKTQENNLITLASVPEREQEKEEDFKIPSKNPLFPLNLSLRAQSRLQIREHQHPRDHLPELHFSEQQETRAELLSLCQRPAQEAGDLHHEQREAAGDRELQEQPLDSGQTEHQRLRGQIRERLPHLLRQASRFRLHGLRSRR